jgi:hypothetical protein
MLSGTPAEFKTTIILYAWAGVIATSLHGIKSIDSRHVKAFPVCPFWKSPDEAGNTTRQSKNCDSVRGGKWMSLQHGPFPSTLLKAFWRIGGASCA